MAKGRNNQAALVPESEQPYEVPGNWCWVRMSSLYQINPKNDAPDDVPSSFIPMDKIAPGMASDFTYDILPWGKAKKGHTQFADGDVAFAKISPCFENRKSMLVEGLENGIGAGTTELIVLRQPNVNQRYTFWLVNDERLIRGGRQTYSGTVGQQRIDMDFVRNYPVPLPPLAEQQRIVDTIEGLFAELDEAKENLLSVLELLEARRKTILHEAFTGALTAKWREEHGVALESWTQSKLMEVGTLQTGLMKGKRYGSAKTVIMPYLRVANVQDGFLKLDEVKEIEVAADSVERYMLRQGDVLFTEGGDFDKLGRGTVWNDEIPNCLHQNHVFAVRTDHSRLLPAFLALQAASKYGKDYFLSCSKQTTNLASINSTQLKNFPVLMPTIEEQTEIVRILDSFFDEERQVKEAAEAALEKIGQMKKSILDDAFRGLLGTNDPAEESAAGLLSETP